MAQDKSVEMDGFMGVIKSNQKTASAVEALKTHIHSPEKVIKKLEEVKSAALIANKHLKDIAAKEIPKPKDFPTEMEVTMKGVSVITLKGDKGEVGRQGVQGAKGDKGESGKEGKVGPKGERGTRGEKGEPGKNGVNGEEGKLGQNGSSDTPDEIVEKVNLSEKRIDAERVRGLVDVIRQVNKIGSNPMGKEAGGGGNVIRYLSNGVVISAYVTELNFSTNVTPVYDGNGRITLTATGGGGTTYSETPGGLINASNKVYTTAHGITTVINLAINGQYIHPAEYSAVGTTITFVTALDSSLSGLPFTIVYQ